MSLRHFFIFLCLLFSNTVFAESDLTNNIEMALTTGDYFSAYRFGVVFENDNPTQFLKTGVDGYLKSLFIIGSKKQIKNECKRLSVQSTSAAYLCALNSIKEKDFDNAKRWINKIDTKTKFFWPGQILKASVEIFESNYDKAIETLNPEQINKYKELQLDALFYLTRARALIGIGRYEEATKYSQSVDSKTDYYVEALEQTAWIFFKNRRFESSQILLDVLVSSYESPKKTDSDLNISPTAYYRARYLRAYLALLEQRPEGASNEFSQLKGDFDKYEKSIKKENLLQNEIHLVQDWLGSEVSERLQKNIKLEGALDQEIQLISKSSNENAKKYLSEIEKLKSKSRIQNEKTLARLSDRLGRAMGTLSLKCDLGRLDVFWLNRAQGARNLEEVIDNYKLTTKSIESYLSL